MVFTPYSLFRELELPPQSTRINDVSFSPCSRFLSCASTDSIAIWEVETGDLLQNIIVKVPVVSIIWHKGKANCMFFGCQDGAVCSIIDFDPSIENKAHPVLTGTAGVVYSLDSCEDSDYVAVAVGSDVQVARQITQESYATFVVMPPPPALPVMEDDADDRIRASSVHLLSGGGRLIASYLNHGIVCWDIMSKTTLWTIIPGHRHRHIGSSMLSPDSSQILVFNLRDGMDLYKFESNIPVQSYRYTPNAESNYTTKLGFLNEGSSVICGAQDGQVRIWDTDTGIQQQILSHNQNLIQTLVCHQGGHYSLIATAEALPKPSVRIWRARSSGSFKWWKTRQSKNRFFNRLYSPLYNHFPALPHFNPLPFIFTIAMCVAIGLASYWWPNITSAGQAMFSMLRAGLLCLYRSFSSALSIAVSSILNVVRPKVDEYLDFFLIWLENDGNAFILIRE